MHESPEPTSIEPHDGAAGRGDIAGFIQRLAAFVLLAALAAAVVWFIFFTPTGRDWRQHPQMARDFFRHHRDITPLVFLAAYILLAVLCLPVWMLQFLAGYCFGMLFGILWCEVGAVAGAIISMMISRWLLGRWFHRRVEARLQRLKRLDEKLGHNGFLVVMACRLLHFAPFGLSNYVFGLTPISVLDVALGTMLGSIFAIAWECAVGSGIHGNWKLGVALAAVNLLVLTPLALRYLFPEWFRKHGIE